SVRLAQRCHQMRKAGIPCPGLQFDTPPDFLSPQADSTFFAQDADTYRFLALADPKYFDRVDVASIDLERFRQKVPQLTHDERRLAGLAIVNLIRRYRRLPFSYASLIVLLFRLHPSRAFRLALTSLFRGQSTT